MNAPLAQSTLFFTVEKMLTIIRHELKLPKDTNRWKKVCIEYPSSLVGLPQPNHKIAIDVTATTLGGHVEKILERAKYLEETYKGIDLYYRMIRVDMIQVFIEKKDLDKAKIIIVQEPYDVIGTLRPPLYFPEYLDDEQITKLEVGPQDFTPVIFARCHSLVTPTVTFPRAQKIFFDRCSMEFVKQWCTPYYFSHPMVEIYLWAPDVDPMDIQYRFKPEQWHVVNSTCWKNEYVHVGITENEFSLATDQEPQQKESMYWTEI